MIKKMVKKVWGLSILCVVFGLFFYFHLTHYLTLHMLQRYENTLQTWAHTHYPATLSIYLLLNVLLIACAVPCATFFALVGGFLFGNIAELYSTICTMAGGIILFLAIRTAIGPYIAKKSTGWIKKLEHGFQKNAFYYLITLRLIPIMPCWVSNVSAGALNVPLSTFILASLIGIFPINFIYVMAGKSIDLILSGHDISISQIFLNPTLFLPLTALTAMGITLLVIKSNFKKHQPL